MNTRRILMMQPQMSMTNRKDNFSYPSGFLLNSCLHALLPVYLFLSKSRFPVVCSLLISWEKILVNCEPFFIMTETWIVGTWVVHTGLNWKWNLLNCASYFYTSAIFNFHYSNLTIHDRSFESFEYNWPQSKNSESTKRALFDVLRAFSILISQELKDNSKSTLVFITFS